MKEGRENDKGTNYYNYPRTITTLNCIPSGNACPGEMPRGESVVPASASVERLRGEDCSASDLCDDPTEDRDREREREEGETGRLMHTKHRYAPHQPPTYVRWPNVLH